MNDEIFLFIHTLIILGGVYRMKQLGREKTNYIMLYSRGIIVGCFYSKSIVCITWRDTLTKVVDSESPKPELKPPDDERQIVRRLLLYCWSFNLAILSHTNELEASLLVDGNLDFQKFFVLHCQIFTCEMLLIGDSYFSWCRDTDEPTEVVDPEPPKPDPKPPEDEMTQFQKFFHDIAGQDMMVDAYELEEVINRGLSKGKCSHTVEVSEHIQFWSCAEVQ